MPYVCSYVKIALQEIQVLLTAFVQNGLDERQLICMVCRFLETNVFPRAHVDADLLAVLNPICPVPA